MTAGIMEPVTEPGAGTPTEPTAPVAPAIPAEPLPGAITKEAQAQQDAKDHSEFMATLPEEMRELPSLKNVKNPVDLATQFVNQGALLGSSLRIPNEDTAADQKEAFYEKLTEVPGVLRIPEEGDEKGMIQLQTKLGVPQTPNDYQIQLEEGKVLEPEFIKSATEEAHSMGFTNRQLNIALNKEVAQREAQAQFEQDYMESSMTELKSIWGQDYETRVAGATQALRVYAQEMPEAAKALEPFKNNPLLIRLLSDMGEQLTEKGHAGMQSAGNYGMTPQEAQLKISEIMNNPDHGYFNGDQAQVDYMLKLREIVASGQPA